MQATRRTLACLALLAASATTAVARGGDGRVGDLERSTMNTNVADLGTPGVRAGATAAKPRVRAGAAPKRPRKGRQRLFWCRSRRPSCAAMTSS
jgi:hypothetical protein